VKPENLRLMNWIGAGGWALIGVALIFNKVGALGLAGVIGIFAVYALIIYFPIVSAFAFETGATRRLRSAALTSNWTLIVLCGLSVAGNIVMTQPAGKALGGILFFVIPAALNIRGLRASPESS
jgi:hypothetical protein